MIKKYIDRILSYIVLSLLGLFSIIYSLYNRDFAEISLRLPFLNFPIFIGEILILTMLILTTIKNFTGTIKLNKAYLTYLSFLAFIVIKALTGYAKFGPLALRHAALFYYSIFAIFAYIFYKENIFTNKKIAIFLTLICLIAMKLVYLHSYYIATFFLLTLIMITACPNLLKAAFFIILLILTPFQSLFATARTMIMANLTTIILTLTLLLATLKLKRTYKIIIFILGVMITVFGILKNTDPSDLRSCTNFKEFYSKYAELNSIVAEKSKGFVPETVNEVKIYNPEIKVDLAREQAIKQDKQLGTAITVKNNDNVKSVIINTVLKPAPVKQQAARIRDLGEAYNCSFFRLMIWEDVLQEIKSAKPKPLLGFSFGKPFRSRSLEILEWGEGDWQRDGWMSIHNGYLDIVYRGGIVGIVFIITLIACMIYMITISVKIRSIQGIFMCGIIVNWLVAANFLEILELPYTAIPFWTLFGLTLAYLNNKKNEDPDRA